MNSPIPLLPGDILLYSKCDFFGWVTSIKTFSPAVHVEMYEGNGMSLASRNGIGVNRYPFREKQLAAVLRPKQQINMAAVTTWFETEFSRFSNTGVRGRPYGWLDLLRFYGIKIFTFGWICSQFVAKACLVGGLDVFAIDYYQGTIDPGDFFLPSAFAWQWVRPDVRKDLTT
jgi:hypothetical protein